MSTVTKKQRTALLGRPWVQSMIASLLCIIIGLLLGLIVLLIINPENGLNGFLVVVKNFWNKSSAKLQLKSFGQTLIKTAPLLMCSLSVLFAYKVGLFNIGAAGQYVVGAGAALYLSLAFNMPWYVAFIAAILCGALLGAISGALKAYCNVNEVISCIMLNWISLYCVNMLLAGFTNGTSPDTLDISAVSKLPTKFLFIDWAAMLGHKNATIAIPLSVIVCVCIWVLLSKTKLGYELKATGLNKNAAKYAGMRERQNIILTMAIAGALAGAGAAMLYLTGFENWKTTQTSVPSMGFNGIAAGFLGGLHPLGAIFSSYFIQHITEGGALLTSKGFPSQVADLITSVIIYLCAFVLFVKHLINRQLGKKAETAVRKGEN